MTTSSLTLPVIFIAPPNTQPEQAFSVESPSTESLANAVPHIAIITTSSRGLVATERCRLVLLKK